jgi:addiction module HigA family antidote
MSNYRLAKEIGVPAQRIGEIIAGRRAITADTDLRLCRFFGLSDGWWLRLQADYDTEIAKVALERLKGDRTGQWSVRVNDQFRICFRWTGGDAENVEIVDYH